MSFQTRVNGGNDTERMRISSAGNVGIATTAPAHALDVAGRMRSRSSAADSTAGIWLADATPTDRAFIGLSNDTAASTVGFFSGGNWRLLVDTSGNTSITGTLTQSSDARLKDDIAPLPYSLATLLALRGVTYRWKDLSLTQDRQVGLIAQEVEAVVPEVVRTDEHGLKSVAYQNLVPLIIEGVKEEHAVRDAEAADLRRQLSALRDENSSLKAAVEALRTTVCAQQAKRTPPCDH